MATPERDTVYTNDGTRADTTTVYTRESNSTGWFVGIIVALALLAIGYLVFSANSGPSTTPVIENTVSPNIEAPAADPVTPAPMETAPATEAPVTEPTTPAPAEEAAPAADMAPATPVEETTTTAPVTEPAI